MIGDEVCGVVGKNYGKYWVSGGGYKVRDLDSRCAIGDVDGVHTLLLI